jgi:hypothetical protein
MSTKKIVMQSTELFMCRSNLTYFGKDIPGQVVGMKKCLHCTQLLDMMQQFGEECDVSERYRGQY